MEVRDFYCPVCQKWVEIRGYGYEYRHLKVGHDMTQDDILTLLCSRSFIHQQYHRDKTEDAHDGAGTA